MAYVGPGFGDSMDGSRVYGEDGDLWMLVEEELGLVPLVGGGD
jgi:hypothetical protein